MNGSNDGLDSFRSPELKGSLALFRKALVETVDLKVQEAKRPLWLVIGALIVAVFFLCIATVANWANMTDSVSNIPFDAISNSVSAAGSEDVYVPNGDVEETGANTSSNPTDNGYVATMSDSNGSVEEEHDPWVNLRSCAPQAINTLMFSGTKLELYELLNGYGITDPDAAEKYLASEYRGPGGQARYEIWQMMYLWEPDYEVPQHGPFTTALWELEPIRRIDSLDRKSVV